MISLGKPWTWSAAHGRTMPPHVTDPNAPVQQARPKAIIGLANPAK